MSIGMASRLFLSWLGFLDRCAGIFSLLLLFREMDFFVAPKLWLPKQLTGKDVSMDSVDWTLCSSGCIVGSSTWCAALAVSIFEEFVTSLSFFFIFLVGLPSSSFFFLQVNLFWILAAKLLIRVMIPLCLGFLVSASSTTSLLSLGTALFGFSLSVNNLLFVLVMGTVLFLEGEAT